MCYCVRRFGGRKKCRTNKYHLVNVVVGFFLVSESMAGGNGGFAGNILKKYETN